jgi:hypothetical protein
MIQACCYFKNTGKKCGYLRGTTCFYFPSQFNPDRQGERPRESILNGQAFVGACTAGSDGYKQVRLHVAITLHMIIYPQYMGLVQDVLI